MRFAAEPVPAVDQQRAAGFGGQILGVVQCAPGQLGEGEARDVSA